ncbi:MAG TPA: acyltransferase family protein [Acidimicrobiales bacterium]|nr:acyltransferase family protein [Acidimicrobiales bacterium]
MVEEGRTEPVAPGPRLPRAPGLDGLRALALLVIMAFHTGFSWIPGGFYSVDCFFVLSGFLITSLLIVEVKNSGTIRLGRFWARRARRLLPALFFLVAVLGVMLAVLPHLIDWPNPVPDALASLFYVANWHFIATGSGYFAGSSAQSPLLHTWTLAIEEQFYLVWPVVVLVVLCGLPGRRGRHRSVDGERRLRLLGVVSAVGALASAGWMWWLVNSGATIERVYYGTDTRAQALLVGAVAAVLLSRHRAPTGAVRGFGAGLAMGGLVGTVAVWHLVPETSRLAFRGGFLLASLAAAAIIAGVVLSPAGPVARALALRPVQYVGRISYGAYLWYWPVILVLSTQRVHLGQWELFACRVALTLMLAAISSKFVEMPIRRGSLPGWRALIGAPAAAGTALLLVVVSSGFQPVAQASTPPSLRPSGSSPGAVRVLLVGDSMAGSLGVTLAPYAAKHHIDLINEGHPGCGLTTDAEYDLLLYHSTPGAPCRLGDPSALLDAWRGYIDEYRPQVVVYLARIDMFTQIHDGTWTSIDGSTFDRYLTSQLRLGLKVLGAHGARVVLMTSPYYNVTADGVVDVPEDTPGRVVRYDQILAQAAKDAPGTTVFPLGTVVDPRHTYQGTVDGVPMRCSDFVHFSVSAGKVIAPRLLPVLLSLGRAAPVSAPAHGPPDPPLVPAWYDKLQCGQS